MKYWIEPRWPGPGTTRKELLAWLFFHCGPRKKRIAEKMCIGDSVLLYETKKNPDPDIPTRGSMTIFGLGVVAGDLECAPQGDPGRRKEGGRRWPLVRAFTLGPHVPLDQKQKGVRLDCVRKVLGWKKRASILTTTQISKKQFEVLKAKLLRRI